MVRATFRMPEKSPHPTVVGRRTAGLRQDTARTPVSPRSLTARDPGAFPDPIGDEHCGDAAMRWSARLPPPPVAFAFSPTGGAVSCSPPR